MKQGWHFGKIFSLEILYIYWKNFTMAYQTAIILLILGIVCAICNTTPVNKNEDGFPADTPVDQIDLRRYRLHSEKKRYIKLGSTQACNENMRFFAVPGDKQKGACDCDWFQCSRPLLYDIKSDKCYLAWSTGPCKSGEWFTFDEKMLPVCKTHGCGETKITESDEGLHYIFPNPSDSKCYEAGTRGFCKEGEQLMIYPNEPIPKCRESTVCYPLMIPQSQQCIQGNKYHQTNGTDCTF